VNRQEKVNSAKKTTQKQLFSGQFHKIFSKSEIVKLRGQEAATMRDQMRYSTQNKVARGLILQ
jgi:hypothetical protein